MDYTDNALLVPLPAAKADRESPGPLVEMALST